MTGHTAKVLAFSTPARNADTAELADVRAALLALLPEDNPLVASVDTVGLVRILGAKLAGHSNCHRFFARPDPPPAPPAPVGIERGDVITISVAGAVSWNGVDVGVIDKDGRVESVEDEAREQAAAGALIAVHYKRHGHPKRAQR